MCQYLPPGVTQSDIDQVFSDTDYYDSLHDSDYTMEDYLESLNDETWENDEKILQRLTAEQDDMDARWNRSVETWTLDISRMEKTTMNKFQELYESLHSDCVIKGDCIHRIGIKEVEDSLRECDLIRAYKNLIALDIIALHIEGIEASLVGMDYQFYLLGKHEVQKSQQCNDLEKMFKNF
jgi:hypothetical protein